MDGKLCPEIHPQPPPPPPALKFSRESPPFNSEISQPPLPFLKFWLESWLPYFTGQARGNEFCVPCDLKGAAMQII